MTMRFNGTLTKWNDDRGFGFITPEKGDGEIFVHISAFPRDSARPSIGERLSFEVELGKDGKKRAIRVQCQTSQGVPSRTRRTASGKPNRKPLSSALGSLVVVAAIGGYFAYSNLMPEHSTTLIPAEYSVESTTPATEDRVFRCDGRIHCSQMTSCAEARYFIKHCRDTRMDGDNDGEPCEGQWCNSW